MTKDALMQFQQLKEKTQPNFDENKYNTKSNQTLIEETLLTARNPITARDQDLKKWSNDDREKVAIVTGEPVIFQQNFQKDHQNPVIRMYKRNKVQTPATYASG